MSIEIRQAREDDVGEMVECIYSAAPELYTFFFKTPKHSPQAFIDYEFHSGKGFCGYPNVTVAVDQGEVVATGCFYDGTQHAALTKQTLKAVRKFYGILGSARVYWRAQHIGSIVKPPAKDELYLSNFGVSERMRSRGIGSMMIQYHLDTAKDRGYRIFSLDVADNNPQAQRLYERLGLQIVEEKTFSAKNAGVPNSRKMELVL